MTYALEVRCSIHLSYGDVLSLQHVKERFSTTGRNRTGTAITGQGILSPSCLPISPLGRVERENTARFRRKSAHHKEIGNQRANLANEPKAKKPPQVPPERPLLTQYERLITSCRPFRRP